MEPPRLRPLEALPVRHQNQPMILLRDPLGYSDAVLLLPPAAYFIVSHFDGRHTLREIQTAFMRRFRQIVFSDHLQGMVRQLDEALFLDNERFQDHRRAAEAAFRAAPARPTAHAGPSYPEDAAGLRAWMDSFFQRPGGPGPLDERAGSGPLAALIAPHIDFERGGHAFAWCYREVARAEPADLYVLLGTGHAACEPFVLTGKDFITPFGVVSTAGDLVRQLADRLPWDPFEGEWVHKGEHSIEFQAVWLAYLLGVEGYQILPVLLGSFEGLMEQEGVPEDLDDRIARFCAALPAVLADSGRRVRFIASVDFAHLGSRFGDRQPMTPAFLQQLRRQDEETLRHLAAGDAEGFWHHLARERNRRRHDGLSTLYVLLRTLPGVRGEILCYDQAVDREEHSVVTFAALAYRPE